MRRPREEFVVQKNGQVRQAGATSADDPTVRAFRLQAEADLFTFAFGVLDQWWLYPPLHKPICGWLQRTPPYRKALIVPRGHCKSTLVCQALPQHMILQPRGGVYFPALDGTDTRILLAGEKIERAQDHLRVIEYEQQNNTLMRSLWPHIAWENARRQAKKWNDSEMIVPRNREWPDPTIRATGVGGATTGMHPNCNIIDDPATENAANSPIVMQTALRWRENARALLSNQMSDLEFTSTTKWAVEDVVTACEKDPTVEVNLDWREVVSGGNVIYPTTSRGDMKFGAPGTIEQLQRQHGAMFWLLYMNNVGDSNLVDFSAADLREFELRDGMIVINEDDRDAGLATAMRSAVGGGDEPPNGGRGMTLTEYLDWQDQHRNSGKVEKQRMEYIRNVRRGQRAGSEDIRELLK